MRAAIYARYSSDNQRAESIVDQVRVCRAFADRSGLVVSDGDIYSDEACSGSIHDRPGLNALCSAAAVRKFEAILVDDASRLSRDNHHFITLLAQLKFWDQVLTAGESEYDTPYCQPERYGVVHCSAKLDYK